MTLELLDELGQFAQLGVYAVVPLVLVVPLFLRGREVACQADGGRTKAAWVAVRYLQFVLIGVCLLGALGWTAGRRPAEILNARSMTCLSNTRMLGLSIMMYTQEWDEHYPRADRWGDLAATTSAVASPESMYRCPNSTSPFGYGFNRAFGGHKMASLADPIGAVMVFEADAPTRNGTGGRELQCAKPRHHGGRNYGYGDSHVYWHPDGFERVARWTP